MQIIRICLALNFKPQAIRYQHITTTSITLLENTAPSEGEYHNGSFRGYIFFETEETKTFKLWVNLLLAETRKTASRSMLKKGST